MRTRQLEVFHAVYTKGTITEAAKSLHVSQPSVSKVLAHTEHQLGFLLFARIKRKLIPTPEADILFSYADKIQQDLSKLKSLATNILTSPPGLIRLACTPSLGIDLVPNLVSIFSSDFPGVHFQTHTFHYDEIINHITEGSIDIGLAYDAKENEQVESIRILEGSFVVLSSDKFPFPNKVLSCEDLHNIPFIKIEGPLSEKLNNFFKVHNFQPNFITTTDTYQMARSFVEKGVGITILDEISASAYNSQYKIWELKHSPVFDVNIILSRSTSRALILENFITFTLSHNYKL
tara:strand:+ start:1069 stop:1941 length:873 start_codon:yes stop_codon:yes gene_type:complete